MLLGRLFDFSASPVLEFLINTILVTFFLLMFGEILPKVIATHYPVQFAKMMAMPISSLLPVARPFNKFMTNFTKKISEHFEQKGEVTLEELSEAVDIATPTASQEKKMLKGIVKLPTISVEKIMKPRVDVVAIDISTLSVDVMKQRGIDARVVDFFDKTFDEKFDTILMAMNGIGIVGKIERLPEFFMRLKQILAPGGQVLLDSSDIRYVFENEDGSFDINLAGAYYGEIARPCREPRGLSRRYTC